MSNNALLWRCPECETLNSGDKCIICGEPKPHTADHVATKVNDVQFTSSSGLKKSNNNQSNLKDQKEPVFKDTRSYEPDRSISDYDNEKEKSHAALFIGIGVVIPIVVIIILIVVNMKLSNINYGALNNNNSITTSNVSLQNNAITYEKSDNNTTTSVPETKTDTSTYTEAVTVNTIEVPSLLYKSLPDAVSELNQLGISFKVEYEDDNRVDKNCIFKQSHKSGTMISENTLLTLYVSNHEETTIFIKECQKQHQSLTD